MNFIENEIKEMIETIRDKYDYRYTESDDLCEITKKELIKDILSFDWEREECLLPDGIVCI